MRTTIDLPDDVFRRAKADAAMRGMKFKDYATALFKRGLQEMDPKPIEWGQKRPIPVVIPEGTFALPEKLTNADIFEAINREDDEKVLESIRSHHLPE